MTESAHPACCAEFASAREITFAYPDAEDGTWLLYGVDFLSVSGGDPALRYWPIRFCPFCGARLENEPIKHPSAPDHGSGI